MSFVNVWNITNKINIDLFKLNEHIILNRFLLNSESKNMCFLEKFIYDIAFFHFKRLNIHFNKDEHFIEFYFTTINTDEFHIENSNLFLKTITYFTPFHRNYSIENTIIDNVSNIDIITNVTNEKYKYKNVFDNIFFYVSFPELLKHIAFEGNKYYHSNFSSSHNENDNIKKTDNNILSLNINLLNKKPLTLPLFSNVCNSNDDEFYDLNFIDEKINLIDCNNNLTHEFIEDIIYNPLSKKYDELINVQKKINSVSLLSQKNEIDLCIFEKDANTKHIIDNFDKNSLIDINLPKFLQRFFIRNKIPKYLCDWIINESKPFLNNIKEDIINVEKIKNIFPLILELFKSIIINIIDYYSIDKKNIFIIDDIYIKKDDYIENELQRKDRLEIDILLTDIKDEYIFEDGICSSIEIGDMLFFKEKTQFTKKKLNQCYLIGKITIKSLVEE